jgi:hypothetical protein
VEAEETAVGVTVTTKSLSPLSREPRHSKQIPRVIANSMQISVARPVKTGDAERQNAELFTAVLITLEVTDFSPCAPLFSLVHATSWLCSLLSVPTFLLKCDCIWLGPTLRKKLARKAA